MLAGEAFSLLAGGKPLVAISYTVATTSLVVQNLRSFLIGQGLWNGTDAIDLTFTIPSGKSVWSNNKTYAAIEILAADFPADSVITIVNAGLICGKGDWATAGGALKATRAVSITNTGTIAGGGYNAAGAGGNYCGGAIWVQGANDNPSGCYSGCTSGAGGTGYGYGYSSAGSPNTNGGSGSSCGGTSYDCTTGDSAQTCYCTVCPGGGGGTGGGAGTSGYAVSGNSFISWASTGTRYGSIS